MGMFGISARWIMEAAGRIVPHQKTARHTEVGDQGLSGIKLRQKILGASLQPLNEGAGQALDEVVGQCKAQVGPVLHDPDEPGTLKVRLQSPANGLDLGQFGHRRQISHAGLVRQSLTSAAEFL